MAARPRPIIFWPSLALVALSAIATGAVLAWAGGYFTTGLPTGITLSTAVAFDAWALAPIVAFGVLVVVAARRLSRGFMAAAVGAVTLTVLTAAALASFVTSDSSTAALMFLSLPLLQWLLLILTLGTVAAVSHARRPGRSA